MIFSDEHICCLANLILEDNDDKTISFIHYLNTVCGYTQLDCHCLVDLALNKLANDGFNVEFDHFSTTKQ